MGGRKKIRHKISGIYKITSPSGRVYIGQSVHIYNRFYLYHYGTGCGNGILKKSFQKYGSKNHIFEIIKECSEEELNYYECYYINLYDSTNRTVGMNLRSGGSRGRHSESSKIKIGNSNRGEKSASFGKKGVLNSSSIKIVQYELNGVFLREWDSIADACRELKMISTNVCKCLKGKTHAAYGYNWKYKGCENIKKEFERPFGIGGKPKKPVLQLDLRGNLIKRWDYISQVEKELGFATSGITFCCQGKYKKAFGYKWEYENKN